MRTAKLSLYLGLVLTLTLGCGEDTEGPGSGGSVSCGDRVPACLTLDESGGFRNQTCLEIHNSRATVSLEDDCVDEGTAMRTFLPGGCPLDDGRLGHCIQETTFGSTVPITVTSVNFWYSTGDDLVDANLRASCVPMYTADTDSGASPSTLVGTWCPGSLP